MPRLRGRIAGIRSGVAPALGLGLLLQLSGLLAQGAGSAPPAPAATASGSVTASAGATPSATASGELTARLGLADATPAGHCPGRGELEELVAARLGRIPFADDGELAVTVTVVTVESGYEATLLIAGPDGSVRKRRTLQADPGRCGELFDALAFAISVAIDPIRAVAPPVAPPTASGSAAAPPTPLPSASAAPSATPAPIGSAPPAAAPSASSDPGGEPTRRGVRPHLALGAHAALGLEPSVASGLEARLGLGLGPWSVEAGARLDSPAGRTIDGGGTLRAELAAAELAACYALGWARGCALGLVGSLQASAEGVPEARSDSALMGLAGLRIQALWSPTPWLSIGPRADLLVTLTPVELAVAGAALWETAPVTAALGIDLLLRVP